MKSLSGLAYRAAWFSDCVASSARICRSYGAVTATSRASSPYLRGRANRAMTSSPHLRGWANRTLTCRTNGTVTSRSHLRTAMGARVSIDLAVRPPVALVMRTSVPVDFAMGAPVTLVVRAPVSESFVMRPFVMMNVMMDWPHERSAAPMVPVMVPVPRLVVPVTIPLPAPPVVVKIMVVDVMIPDGHAQDIIRGYDNHRLRDKRGRNKAPGPDVIKGSEPETPVESVPVASVEIKAHRVWHQVNRSRSTGDDHDVRGRRKFKRRRSFGFGGRGLFLSRRRRGRDIDVNVYVRRHPGQR